MNKPPHNTAESNTESLATPRRHNHTPYTANDLTKLVLVAVSTSGGMAQRINSGHIQTAYGSWVGLAMKGTSDIIGLDKKGRYLAIEIKKGRDRMTKFQLSFQREVEKRGGLYHIVRNEDDIEVLTKMIGQ